MTNALRVSLLITAVLLGIDTEGCTPACLRHTDCNSGEQCIVGTCMIVVHPDGAVSVDAMTPKASPTTTATASAKPSSSTDGAPPVMGIQGSWDGASTLPVSPDASIDASSTF